MQTVGDYLKKEREAKNISLSEVSRLTKISKFYLDFLEKDDYEKLPQGPYIKGYISSYARLIGSNPDEALRLYDSPYEEKKQTEAVQSKISKDEGRQASIASSPKSIVSSLNEKKNNRQKIQPEKARSKARKALAATVALFKAITASLRIAGCNLKAAMPSSRTIMSWSKAYSLLIKAIAPSIQKASFSLKTIAPSLKKATALNTNRWLFNKRTWLYACFVLLSSTILVLAGFGFYHLFIYQKNPPLVADLGVRQDKGSKANLSMNAERDVLPSRSNDASVSSHQLSSNPVAEMSSETSLLSESPASEGITAGKEMSAQSSQSPISASLSPESTSAFVNPEVLKATICADIKDRMPTGAADSFPWSTHRVYAWSLVKAKHLPSKIRHIYYFKGQKISDLALNVRSSYWRTWSYKTISNERYRGPWRVDIASAEGQVLQSLYFEVN